MNLKRTALILTLGVFGLAAMAATADAQPIQPAKQEVLARAQNQRHEIGAQERAGKISLQKAHHLLVAERRIARKAHMHGARLTRVDARKLNHQENRIQHHIRS